jgi:hypothetical protein
MSHHETRRRMAALVRRWQAGSVPQAEFAARHSISRTKLRYWLRRVGAERPTAAVGFAPVQLVDDATAAIEVVFGSGARVIVRASASPELARAAIAAARSTC